MTAATPAPVARDAPRRAQRWPLLAGLLVLAAGSVGLAADSPRLAALFLIGALLGVTLSHATFGFTSAYRRLLVAREASGVRAQLVMLAVATLLFAPVLASGSALGHAVVGADAPVGWQVAVGAFVFGIGMQLGNGCGSGTLYALGGGSLRMLFTLASFCAGSFWASLHMGWWQGLPTAPPLVLGESLGWAPAVVLQLAVLFLLWRVLRPWDRPAAPARDTRWRLVTGPWPLLAGALALAILNLFTLLVAGHPWTITWAFALWGAKGAQALGWDPAGSDFWHADFQQAALAESLFRDVTSVMDLGLVAGAFCATAAAGGLAPTLRIPPRSLVAAVLGGLLMGYGARIAFGCNVGAFFSGVASTSLHGWLWIVAALPGNWLGIKLRPWFGLRL